MNDSEAKALAILVGGTAIDGKVYVDAPELKDAPEGRMCLGCAFAENGRVPRMGTPTWAACECFRSCVGLIHVELKL